jgi:hypothetical protein
MKTKIPAISARVDEMYLMAPPRFLDGIEWALGLSLLIGNTPPDEKLALGKR